MNTELVFIQNKMRTSLVGAISKAQKAESLRICPGCIEKLRKQFRNIQRAHFMLDKTRKPIFHQPGIKKHSLRKNFGLFPWENVA